MIGRTFAQYHVLEKLGEGSMGVVYKAEHVQLKHLVVLKFLRPEYAADEVRYARFLREAKIAAAIDCPGICQVLDYGNDGAGIHYLVMRYCDGLSLKDRISQGPLPLTAAVLYAIQVAEGLQAAHSHGIVHRDIKPANIVISMHGTDSVAASNGVDSDETLDLPDLAEQAKITDFGLAYLASDARLTVSCSVLGTPAYMSPEQVMGEEADFRSDIWSLGTLLYEMVTGRPPFGTGPAEAVMHAVRHQEPVSLAGLRAEAPPELAWIVGKALRKDPAARYRDAEEMLRDLRMLRQKLVSRGDRPAGSWVVESRRRVAGLTVGLVAVAAALLAVRFLSPSEARQDLILGRPLEVTREIGWEGAPAVSPDGSRIVYAGDKFGSLDLYLIPMRGGPALRLTDDPATDTEPAWLPDGTGLLFTSNRLETKSVWKVGATGGDATLVVPNAWDPAVSPDGSLVAFCRNGHGGMSRIFVAPLATPGAASQLTFAEHGTINHASPAWSPDGRTLCYATYDDLWLVPAAGGQARRLTSGGLADASPAWSADGRSIFFASQREETRALWRVSATGGEAKRLTPGAGPESEPSIAANGSVLAFTTGVAEGNDDVVILSRETGERHSISGLDETYQPALSPDGRTLCYVSNRWEGRRELWLQALQDGRPIGEPRRLTDQPGLAAFPSFSPDGKRLAYYRIEETGRRVWIAGVDGGTPWPLTGGGSASVQPVWSPDGGRIAFVSDRDGLMGIYTVPVTQGPEPVQPLCLSPPGLPSFLPTWSPDGRQLAFLATRGDRSEVWIVGSDGSRVARRLPLSAEPHMAWWGHMDGQLWVSADWEGVPGVRAVDPVTGAAAALEPPVRFESDVSFAQFHADAKGDLVVYCRASRQGNIWILEADVGSF